MDTGTSFEKTIMDIFDHSEDCVLFIHPALREWNKDKESKMYDNSVDEWGNIELPGGYMWSFINSDLDELSIGYMNNLRRKQNNSVVLENLENVVDREKTKFLSSFDSI